MCRLTWVLVFLVIYETEGKRNLARTAAVELGDNPLQKKYSEEKSVFAYITPVRDHNKTINQKKQRVQKLENKKLLEKVKNKLLPKDFSVFKRKFEECRRRQSILSTHEVSNSCYKEVTSSTNNEVETFVYGKRKGKDKQEIQSKNPKETRQKIHRNKYDSKIQTTTSSPLKSGYKNHLGMTPLKQKKKQKLDVTDSPVKTKTLVKNLKVQRMVPSKKDQKSTSTIHSDYQNPRNSRRSEVYPPKKETQLSHPEDFPNTNYVSGIYCDQRYPAENINQPEKKDPYHGYNIYNSGYYDERENPDGNYVPTYGNQNLQNPYHYHQFDEDYSKKKNQYNPEYDYYYDPFDEMFLRKMENPYGNNQHRFYFVPNGPNYATSYGPNNYHSWYRQPSKTSQNYPNRKEKRLSGSQNMSKVKFENISRHYFFPTIAPSRPNPYENAYLELTANINFAPNPTTKPKPNPYGTYPSYGQSSMDPPRDRYPPSPYKPYQNSNPHYYTPYQNYYDNRDRYQFLNRENPIYFGILAW